MDGLYYILFSTYPGIVRKHLRAAVKALWDMMCEVPFRFGQWRKKATCSCCGRDYRHFVEPGSAFWSEEYANVMGVKRGTNWCARCVRGDDAKARLARFTERITPPVKLAGNVPFPPELVFRPGGKNRLPR